MASSTLTKRLEALEQAHGISKSTVKLLFRCPDCGEPLEADDRGSRCNTHPNVKRANLNLIISFRSPDNAEVTS
jgi:ABC-type ATPase with predicted acetyltransferase domain